MITLKCTRCERRLPEDKFSASSTTRGRQYWCRKCMAAYQKGYDRKPQRTIKEEMANGKETYAIPAKG